MPNYLRHWAKLNSCKWPNIEQNIFPFGHTDAMQGVADSFNALMATSEAV